MEYKENNKNGRNITFFKMQLNTQTRILKHIYVVNKLIYFFKIGGFIKYKLLSLIACHKCKLTKKNVN